MYMILYESLSEAEKIRKKNYVDQNNVKILRQNNFLIFGLYGKTTQETVDETFDIDAESIENLRFVVF